MTPPDVDGVLWNVVRDVLVLVHVAGSNHQHGPVVGEGQAGRREITDYFRRSGSSFGSALCLSILGSNPAFTLRRTTKTTSSVGFCGYLSAI
jgi:hypothetical protein